LKKKEHRQTTDALFFYLVGNRQSRATPQKQSKFGTFSVLSGSGLSPRASGKTLNVSGHFPHVAGNVPDDA
jgi:hypothetical protein